MNLKEVKLRLVVSGGWQRCGGDRAGGAWVIATAVRVCGEENI